MNPFPPRSRPPLDSTPLPSGKVCSDSRRRRIHAAIAFAALFAVATDRGAAGAVQQPLFQLEQQAWQQAAALADPSVVRIETVGGLDVVGNELVGAGPTTGVLVSGNGDIITSSFNFASKPASVLVTLGDGRRFPAQVVATDRSRMLTLLKIEAGGLTPLPAAPKSETRVGQWALALGRTYDNAFPGLSVGIVSATNRMWGRALQTDAKVSPTNYGGPLVDLSGRGLGVIVPLSPQGKDETAGVEWYDGGIGFAIPMDDVYAVLERLKAGKDLKPGLLGVTFPDFGPLAGEPRLDRVRPGSPAGEAGLKRGDVILAADGRPIERVPDLQHVLGPKYADEQITLVVQRGSDTFERTITLASELVPWQSAYLGVLPARAAVGTPTEGVTLRAVLDGSPAHAAGLMAGDTIEGVNAAPVANSAALLDVVSRLLPGAQAEIAYRRGGAVETVTVELTALPDEAAHPVPAERIPSPADPESRPPTGRFTQTLPGETQAYWAYVPTQYNPDYAYTLLVWLHPPADTMEAAMMQRWQAHCDDRGMILVAPKAAAISGWTPEEADFISAVVEQMRKTYSVDPARIVVHGYGAGGDMTWHVAFKYRELFRGACVASAPLKAPPPDTDPALRQQLHLVCGARDPLAPTIEEVMKALRELKFPVQITQVEQLGEQYPDAADVEPLAIWIDAIDRI